MQAVGWIDWQGNSGRAARSCLRFLCSVEDLQRAQASSLLQQGRIAQAMSMLNDRQSMSALLLAQLGQRWEQGRQVLTVPYYRPLRNLSPAGALRRTERHLVSQIFSGLTRMNEASGEIEPDLAHHWQMRDPLTWQFHLRPAVRWHDGQPLRMEQVIASLRRLIGTPLYGHWRAVTASAPRCVTIELSSPDCWLPWLLADGSASIVPSGLADTPDFAAHPVGTGPYRVESNDAWQLRLQAFDDYFGWRALLDQVNIVVVPEVMGECAWSIHGLSGALQIRAREDEALLESRMEMGCEQGCYFLLFDGRVDTLRDPLLRQWLSWLLMPVALLGTLASDVMGNWTPAASVLPTWFHTRPLAMVMPDCLPESLRLGYYADQPHYPLLAEAIASRLAEHGISLQCGAVPYADWEQGQGKFDLWLGSVNFASPIDYAVPAWLFGSPLLRACLFGLPLAQWQEDWRAGKCHASEMAAELVGQQWLLPLFHLWYRLSGSCRAQGVRLNSLGWFDFKSAWLLGP